MTNAQLHPLQLSLHTGENKYIIFLYKNLPHGDQETISTFQIDFKRSWSPGESGGSFVDAKLSVLVVWTEKRLGQRNMFSNFCTSVWTSQILLQHSAGREV